MVKIKGAKDKVRRKYVNSFARQYLYDHGISMFSGENPILTPVGEELYKIKLPNTRYYIGETFAEEGEIKKITSYEELKSIGFVIISISLDQSSRWETGQKVRYELRRADETGECINKIPKEHYIEYDSNNAALRLMGPRAGRLNFGPWVLVKKKSQYHGGGSEKKITNFVRDADKILEKQMNRWMNVEDETKPVYIKEAAFMITNTNEIVCLPHVQDMPSIIVSGMKGCQVGTDIVLMADETFKQIKDIKVGDVVLSPQENGTYIPSKVLKTTSWFCDEMYEIRELNRNKKLLYTCSYNHKIPLAKHTGPRVKGEEIDLTYNTAQEYSKFSKENKQNHTTLLSPLNEIKHKEKKEGRMYLSLNKISIEAKPTKSAMVYGFTLDSPSNLYITNDYIVTHNSGKCIVQDTDKDFIVDAQGNLVKIKDKPKEVICLGNDLKFKKTKVKGYFNRRVDKIIEIETRTGRSIKLTPEHPLFTVLGWKEAQKLKIGDFIGIIGSLDFDGGKYLRKHEIRLFTYALTRGRIFNCGFVLPFHRFYDVNKEIDDALKMVDPNLYRNKKGKVLSKSKKNKFDKLMKKWGIYETHRSKRKIPNLLMSAIDKSIINFLNDYMTYSGELVCQLSKTSHKQGFIFKCPNPIISKQVLHLLSRFKIGGYILKKKTARTYLENNKVDKVLGRYTGVDHICSYHVENVKNFLKIFKPRLKQHKKRVAIEEPYLYKKENVSPRCQVVPKEIFKLAKPLDWKKVEKGLGWTVGKNFPFKWGHDVSKKNFEVIAKHSDSPLLEMHANSDIIWDDIKSINVREGSFKVWDIEVEDPSHNFIANDIIVHNSFAVHSIVSRLFWKPAFDYKIAILNDSSRETGTWNLPNQDTDQINILKRLNERPLPLPCVYLHPLVKEDYEKLFMGDVGFDVTIPFNEIINNHKEYLNLKESSRYFTKIANELINCKTQKEAEGLFDDLVLHYNVPVQTSNKIRAEFDTLFDSRMTDISTKGQHPWSTSKRKNKKFNSITASLHAGVLPVLETEFVSNYRQLLSIYFTYFVKDIFNRQKQDPDFLEEKSEILLVCDEAHNISKKGYRTGADRLLRRCVREGRPRRLGTLLATQKFNELPDVIKDNTTYLICFKNVGEAAEIVNQYNMGKHMVNTIRDLGKHECIAYTTEHFVVYDSNGNKRKSKLNEVFIGKTLPPYSQHKKPNA